MPTAVVLGGAGLVGGAVCSRLVAAGWDVTATGRAPVAACAGRYVAADRGDPDDLARVLSSGADVVVDCVGYTAAHSRLLLRHARDLGSIVFVSSKAVYVDDVGNHSNSPYPPRFTRPVREDQPTMAPSDIPFDSPLGYGANKVAAERVLLDSDVAVSVLRPSRIHGVGARYPREWVFVRRVLDARPHVLLAARGQGVNHPTAAVNLAALVEVCARTPGTRVVNSADPDAPDGLEIARTVAAHFAHSWREVLLDDDAADVPDGLGDHPWNSVPPVVLDTTASLALGYRPVGTYAETVGRELDWLVGHRPADDDPRFASSFDYATEDAWLARGVG